MFTLAQYVFGKTCSTDDSNNQCVQTDIENDWILIDVERENTVSQDAVQDDPALKKTPKSRLTSKENNTKPLLEKIDKDVKLEEEPSSLSVFDNVFSSQNKNGNNKSNKVIQKLPLIGKKSSSGKENAVTVRSNKKHIEVSHPASGVLLVSNQNKALTAIAQRSEAFNKKKFINKKDYERQNKVAKERNGPIIRHKKMFSHLNGAYHTRHQC